MSTVVSCLFGAFDVYRTHLGKANVSGFGKEQELWSGGSPHCYYHNLKCAQRSLSATCKTTMVIRPSVWKIQPFSRPHEWQREETGFEVVSVHESPGRWATHGLKTEPLKELATNLEDLAEAGGEHYSCVWGPFGNRRHVIERLGQRLPPDS